MNNITSFTFLTSFKDRVIQILTRRTKNNPCLIGEPGVGKTAIAEGLAEKIVSEDLYSFIVVAPITCISPLDSKGFKILAASIAPSAAPAPTIV